VIIGIQTADCVPIMLTNRDGKIIAAIHCGWKGALMGVIQNTCDMLRNNFNNNRGLSFTSVICPSIAQVNYEFGSELRDKFIKNDHHTKEFFLQTDKFLFDLRGYVKHLLIRNGIDISISLDDDTYAMSEQYMSHRHNTHLGIIDERRMLSTILMRSLHI
jgi:YfiH family protein